MWKLLIKLNKNLVYAIPAFLIMGFTFGVVLDGSTIKVLKGLIVPLTFLMVYPMMVTLNIKHLKQGLNIRLQAITQLVNFGIIPFIDYLHPVAPAVRC